MDNQFDEAMIHYREAGEYLHKGVFDKAISSANMAISLIPDLAPAYNIRGNAHYGKKEYLISIEDQTSAIEYTEKKEYDFQHEISRSGNSRIDEKFNELKISKAWIYFNRGNAYDDIGDFENAEKDFSESIKLYPEFANAYNSRGIMYENNGDYISAIEDFTKAIRFNYERIHFAYNNRADAYLHLERYKDAVSDCQKAIGLEPAYAHAYNTCGLAYAAMNDNDNAWLYYKRAIAVDPGYSEPMNNLKYLGKFKAGKYETFTSVSLTPDSGIDFYGGE
jgi:tetratricopeptide (TPR) repeat protein